MKKLALAVVATSILSTASSVFAWKADSFYAKVGVGVGMTNPQKINSIVTKQDIKMKSKMVFSGDVGGGYVIDENFGIGLLVGGNFGLSKEKKITTKDKLASGEEIENTVKGKITANTMSILVNPVVHMPISDEFSLVGNLGLGMASVRDKADLERSTTQKDVKYDNLSGKSKSKIGFSWMIGAGVEYQVTEDVALGIGYSYQDYGKSKGITVKDKENKTVLLSAKNHYRSHNVKLNLVFNF